MFPLKKLFALSKIIWFSHQRGNSYTHINNGPTSSLTQSTTDTHILTFSSKHVCDSVLKFHRRYLQQECVWRWREGRVHICQSASSWREACGVGSTGGWGEWRACRQPAVKLRHVRRRLTGPTLWSDNHRHQAATACHLIGAVRGWQVQSGGSRCLTQHFKH